MTFSEAIREIRQYNFLSQEKFAKVLGVSFSTVNRWEKGRAIPNCITMQRIAKYCKDNNIDFKKADCAWKSIKNANG